MSTRKEPVEKAFAAARDIAARSQVSRLLAPALDFSTESDFDDALERVRAVLVGEYRKSGCTIEDDPEGVKLHAKLPDELSSAFWSQLTNREEAGYLYGLAVGLALASKGGAR